LHIEAESVVARVISRQGNRVVGRRSRCKKAGAKGRVGKDEVARAGSIYGRAIHAHGKRAVDVDAGTRVLKGATIEN